MAPRQPVPVTRGAAGDPAMTSDALALVVGDAWCCEQRLQASGSPEALGPARPARPVAEAGAR